MTRTKPIPRRRSKPRRGPLRDRGYLAWLRCQYCQPHARLAIFHGGCDPCHGPVNGMRSRGPDNEATAMCRPLHEEQTIIGWPAFESKYGFNRAESAAKLYRIYRESKERKCRN